MQVFVLWSGVCFFLFPLLRRATPGLVCVCACRVCARLSSIATRHCFHCLLMFCFSFLSVRTCVLQGHALRQRRWEAVGPVRPVRRAANVWRRAGAGCLVSLFRHVLHLRTCTITLQCQCFCPSSAHVYRLFAKASLLHLHTFSVALPANNTRGREGKKERERQREREHRRSGGHVQRGASSVAAA